MKLKAGEALSLISFRLVFLEHLLVVYAFLVDFSVRLRIEQSSHPWVQCIFWAGVYFSRFDMVECCART